MKQKKKAFKQDVRKSLHLTVTSHNIHPLWIQTTFLFPDHAIAHAFSSPKSLSDKVAFKVHMKFAA